MKPEKWRRVLPCLFMMLTFFALTALADDPAYTTISLNTTYTISGKQGQDLYYRYPIDESRYGTYTLWVENINEMNANASMNGNPQYNRRSYSPGPIDLHIIPTSDRASFRLVKIKPAASITIKNVPKATAQSILEYGDNVNYDGIVFEVTYTDGSTGNHVYKETYRGEDPHVQSRYMHWTDDGGVYLPEFNKSTSTLRIRHFCIGDSSGLLSGEYKLTVVSGKSDNTVTEQDTGSDTGSAHVTEQVTSSTGTTVNPTGTSVKKLASGRKQFTIKWKKSGPDITGYQIRYSLKSNMKKAKKVTVAKKGVTSKTVRKLKSGKKYFVQIRTYKTVDGKTYYSAWSKKKTVRTK